jgi:hypothetical protein
METRWSCSITYFKSQIDYTHQRADTIYGVIGIKVWLFIVNKIIGKNSQSGGKMLSPKRTKYRKMQRGRMKACRNNRLVHGEYGIQALEPVWLTSRQIEAVRRTITRYTKRTGKLWIKVFQIKLLLLVQKNHVWDLEKVLLIIG